MYDMKDDPFWTEENEKDSVKEEESCEDSEVIYFKDPPKKTEVNASENTSEETTKVENVEILDKNEEKIQDESDKKGSKKKTFFEKLGYQAKEKKESPTFIERRVKNPKARIGIYIGIIVLCAIIIVLKFTVLNKLF